MTLFLYETVPSADQQNDPSALIDAIARSLTDSGAGVTETKISKPAARLFTTATVTHATAGPAPARVATSLGAAEVTEPAQVRLVGTDPEKINASRPEAGLLVEWGIPSESEMGT